MSDMQVYILEKLKEYEEIVGTTYNPRKFVKWLTSLSDDQMNGFIKGINPGDIYYIVAFDAYDGKFHVEKRVWNNTKFDDQVEGYGNFFTTIYEADYAASELNKLLFSGPIFHKRRK